jgi:hypothetical protein
MSGQHEYETVRMEINGQPYYVKSKGNVPYLYDIDTHDEVGYWSSKKGQYIMFSLYNRMMKEKYENDTENITNCSSDSTTETDDSKSDSSSSSQEEEEEESSSQEEEESRVETKNHMNADRYSLVFLFLILFVYLTLQKEFQSIYFDFIFLILINLLNTLKVFEILNDE